MLKTFYERKLQDSLCISIEYSQNKTLYRASISADDLLVLLLAKHYN